MLRTRRWGASKRLGDNVEPDDAYRALGVLFSHWVITKEDMRKATRQGLLGPGRSVSNSRSDDAVEWKRPIHVCLTEARVPRSRRSSLLPDNQGNGRFSPRVYI